MRKTWYSELVKHSSSTPADSPVHPGKILRQKLEERGWTQDEFALITGRNKKTIGNIITGKTGISPDMAVALSVVFKDSASDWMNWDNQYSLSLVESDAIDIGRRADLYTKAPIREMQKRGWIKATTDPAGLESELSAFFAPQLAVSTRRAGPSQNLTPIQSAWCYRARQLASALVVQAFDSNQLSALEKDLRVLAAYPSEVRHLPKVFGKYGIRFIIVEPLTGAKIDGAAFWLSEKAPVIAVSARFDRIDAFWFTVMHEFSHIRHGDALSVDDELIGETGCMEVITKDEFETRADSEAAASLIAKDELDSFVRRLGPLYSKERIIQFAHRIKIHPGIIVGQLQHRGEVGYFAHRELLAKVRSIITETALTDGWGKTISLGLL
jgi:HTH-type transcriptional regulator/antitoxin HigA